MPSLLELVAAQKTPRLSASDHVAQTLKKAIVDGLLPAGELLRQDEIASHFHVSKIPVREALKHLEAKGLVTFLRNRGAVVASLSAAEIARRRLDAREGCRYLFRIAPPGVGEDHRPMHPVKELHAELFFEKLDLVAHRRRRDEQLFSRQGERRQARRCLERLYRLERNPI